MMIDITAKTFHGLEDVLAEEIRALGGEQVKPIKRAVLFKGNKAMIYKANLHLRTALRILLPVANFKVRSEEELYKRVKRVKWSKYIDHADTLAVDAVVKSKYFKHSQYVALKTKDAIVDQFREEFFRRPNVNTATPHLRVNILITDENCTVSVDTSGDSLHKRGYRKEGHIAPLNEVLAAGMIGLSGWKGEKTFIDPMCGSGTLLSEAAFVASNTPPQLDRDYFAFKKMKDFDEKLWNTILAEAKANIKPIRCKILGFDKSFKAVRIAERNLELAGFKDSVVVSRQKFEKNTPPDKEGILIMNPPYGERIETSEDILDFYKMIGDKLKQDFAGYTAWVITSNYDAIKTIGLRPDQKLVLYNGPLQCKFHRFDLYEGSRFEEA